MMKILVSIVVSILFICSSISADSYCVMSGEDGNIIEEKDMHKQQSVASISKIMTAIIVIENGNLYDTWKCSDAIDKAYGSMLYLKKGQEVSVEMLLYGLLLRSGNDAAVELAHHQSGSIEAFVDRMNKKAKDIGMLNTVFKNPSGLDEEDGGNLSTAYDMAILMRYAIQNPVFVKISSSKYYKTKENGTWRNKNRLLFEYPFTISGKTGFTKKAGRTLVSAASYNDMHSIVVTLNKGDDFAFHEEKHTAFLNDYKNLEVLEKGTYRILGRNYTVDEAISMNLKKDTKEQIETFSYIDKKKLYVEVLQKGNEQVFSYMAGKGVRK